MTRRSVFAPLSIVVLLAFCIGFFSAGQAEAAKYNWRLAHEEKDDGFMGSYAREFKKRLAEKSNGQINLDVYPSGTLGTSEDLVELVQQGAIDFNFADAGHVGSLVPENQALLLHYIFPKDWDIVMDVMKNGKFKDVLAKKFAEKNLMALSTFSEGWQTWTSNKLIRKPADFKGFKMRTMTSRLIVENYKAYGASPVPTPWGEVYSGLQLGVLDGQVNCPFFIEEQHIDEVQDYLIFSYCNPFLMTLITNPQFFEALPADIQKIVYETVEELLPFSFQWQIEFNEKRLKKMQQRKPNLKVVYLTQDEVDVFKKLASPMKEVYYDIAGKDGKIFLETLEKDIEDAIKRKKN